MKNLHSPLREPGVTDRFRVAQIDAAVRLAPISALASAATVFVVVLSFWPYGDHAYLIALFLAIQSVVLAILFGCSRWAGSSSRSPRTAMTAAVAGGGALGLLWGTMPMELFATGDSREQLLITGTVTGLICTGVVVAPLVRAALAFMLPIIAGSFIALAQTGDRFFLFIGSLLAFYALFVSFSAIYLSRLFQERFTEQLRVEDQAATISLLLRDFERTASDWLWRTDSLGRLRDVSDRFADALDASSMDLERAPFIDILRNAHDGTLASDHASLDELQSCMTASRHFRDCVVEGRAHGERRWWSFTGAPEFDAQGNFLGYRGVGSDVTIARESAAKIAYLASHDMLTGLPNRASFEQSIGHAFEGLASNEEHFALLCIDLDGFKAVNDTWGHPAGDALLRAVAGRLRSCVRERDRIARIGGDEFAVIDRSGEPGSATALASRIIEHLSAPYQIDAMDFSISASIGVAYAPHHGIDLGSLLKNCDIALYEAKLTGRRNYRVCTV